MFSDISCRIYGIQAKTLWRFETFKQFSNNSDPKGRLARVKRRATPENELSAIFSHCIHRNPERIHENRVQHPPTVGSRFSNILSRTIPGRKTMFSSIN